MTKLELNRDIKRLRAYYTVNKNNAVTEIDPQYLEAEFLRLYRADSSFESMNKRNILFMLRLNLRHRFVPLHQYGIFINL